MTAHSVREGHPRGRQAGFTLVELMIVIAILAIIATIAYPNYQDYVIRSKRADAKSMLSQVASRQEQFFLNNKSYTTTLSAVWSADAGDVDDDGNTTEFISEAGYYALTVAAGPTSNIATSYLLTAVPHNSPQTTDVECQAFTLNSRGVRDTADSNPPSGARTGTAADCW